MDLHENTHVAENYMKQVNKVIKIKKVQHQTRKNKTIL